jgi:release factor glutamine methyltransferase
LTSVEFWLDRLRQRLAPESDTAYLDAQVLLAHVLGRPRAWLLAHPEETLNLKQERSLEGALERLEGGEPLPYVLGHWEFYGLDFLVTPATLIPRPETEPLVEGALEWLRANPGRRRGVDVGAGSGCIAVALAVNALDLHVMACDLSLPALKVAWQNACRHGVGERVLCLQSDLLPATGERFDLICANLPYIPSERLPTLRVSEREPRLALDGGMMGLHHIRRLLEIAPHRLAPGGLLLLEIEASQGAQACDLARRSFPEARLSVLPDLGGNDRLVKVRLV